MALSAYLNLTGKNQGDIKGPGTQFGREDSIEICGWHHEVTSPRDPASGMATGKRQHKAITVIKTVDNTTPLLMRALVTNELITFWQLECWRPSMDGTQQPYYRIELSNAAVTGIASEQFNNQNPEHADLQIQEHVSFMYQKITWTWLEGNVSAEDNLTSRV